MDLNGRACCKACRSATPGELGQLDLLRQPESEKQVEPRHAHAVWTNGHPLSRINPSNEVFLLQRCRIRKQDVTAKDWSRHEENEAWSHLQ